MEKTEPWTGRSIVVCGGSSGLGLQLVMAAAKQNAKIAIVGRDFQRLESAKSIALENGAKTVETFSVDLGLQATHHGNDAERMRKWLASNPVDLLVNAIGRSDRGLLEQLTDSDIASLFNDNVVCTWNMTRMALDAVKRARGTIVNIGSLAGIVPAPGMGGYSIAKSALTAMTRQLRLELAKDGVHVMLVCPGPIARDDSTTRYEKLAAQRGLDNPSAKAPGGGVKIRLIDPVLLCKRILDAASKRKIEIITPPKASWLAAIASLSPSLADWILKKYLRTSTP